ncbi:MAG: 30S ribosomal protein S17 [Spirochaetales bacterium]|nr:30S ribosomal protein S17 [Spirochaetales bacterium]MCF7937794.1 30S ribosomal protein S17 [Spirochaetales bacterium]
MEETKKKVQRKEYSGYVTSDKMEKTIVVKIVGKKLHSLYKKYINSSKKVKAHDENNDANTGDYVRIRETRPLSKDKRWELVEIVERAK